MNELFDAPSFEDQQKAWSSPPVDDVGYISSAELLELPDDKFLAMFERMEQARYTGWRNWNRHWRDVLGLDETKSKVVLDYGCGVGMEALQYSRNWNEVHIADITPLNLSVAARLFHLNNQKAPKGYLIHEESPFIFPKVKFDVIHCCGVLHHIPQPRPVVEAMHGWLAENGELRLMLYSDDAWKIATGTEPPEGDVSGYEEFEAFVRHWDGVGDWADWYDKPKLMNLTGDLFRLTRYRPLTSNGAYVGAVLVKQ